MLTIQYLPYAQIASLSSSDRINTILSLLKSGKIVILEGRLSSSDEASLIRETMNVIDGDFNGVEIGVMRDHNQKNWTDRIKHGISKWLIGDRSGITFIGPAKIISELRQHPENVELNFQKEYLLKNIKKDVKPIIQKVVIKKVVSSDKSKKSSNLKNIKTRVR